MNKAIFVWIKDIKISGSLPTANCEFISNSKTMHAITSAEIARTSRTSCGLAQIVFSHDSRGNIIICSIKPIYTQCSEQQYFQLVNIVESKHEHLVGRFLKLISFVTYPELHPFTNFILSEAKILNAFLQSQASYAHHHAYGSGLFEHSIEVAEITYHNAKHLMHSELECQIGLIAGLFHDIGKIYPALHNLTNAYVAGPHESYNFAILAKPLGQLGTLNSKVFALLCELIAAKPYGHKTRYALEYVLKQADRTSAESNFVKKQFEELPSHYFFTKVKGDIIYRLNNL